MNRVPSEFNPLYEVGVSNTDDRAGVRIMYRTYIILLPLRQGIIVLHNPKLDFFSSQIQTF